jgi:hypothetical protein
LPSPFVMILLVRLRSNVGNPHAEGCPFAQLTLDLNRPRCGALAIHRAMLRPKPRAVVLAVVRSRVIRLEEAVKDAPSDLLG